MSKIYAKDTKENILEKIYYFLNNNTKIYHLSLGYISAISVESINSIRNEGIVEVFKEIFFISRNFSNVITYLAMLIIIIYIIGKIILKKYFENRTVDSRLRDVYKKYTDGIFIGHETEGISWGAGQTLVSSPNIRDGWKTKDIRFEIDNSLYNLEMLKNFDLSLEERNLTAEYEEYMKEEFWKQYTIDSDRLMLRQRPVAMTDANALCIKLKKIKWSQLQFMWNKVLTDDIRKNAIDKIFADKSINHPNSFCLHLIVKTSDGKILITKNSINKENDYAQSWAVSIGEQIDKEDIKNIDDDCAYYWVKRALNEELCINEGEFNKEGIHYLSINIEGDILNFAFVCVVEIVLDANNLKNRLCTEARIDNEFKHLEFMEIDDIPKELIKSSRTYHPSSKIRMIYAYLNSKGASQLRYQLLKNEYQ